jgi:hypothetical protein
VPALAGGGPHAYVADGTGLIEVATPGGSQVVAPGLVDWCNADARAQVVWFRRDGDLFAFDMVDRRVHPMLAAPIPSEVDAVVIDWGDQQLAESKVDFRLAVALHMRGTPSIGGLLGCEGDQAFSCYVFEDGGQTLQPNLAAAVKAAGALRFADPAFATALSRRGETGSLWSMPPMPPLDPKKKPRVDKKGCTEQVERCGQLRAIPGNPLWLVQTGNSRGDFYHESWNLWSPATGEFLDVKDGNVSHHKQPDPSGPEYGGLRAATNGALSYEGVVFDGATVYYAPKPSGRAGRSCGWSNGGFRIEGPRG